jgi:hypothetical protein
MTANGTARPFPFRHGRARPGHLPRDPNQCQLGTIEAMALDRRIKSGDDEEGYFVST